MQVYIEGQQTDLPPELRQWIAQRLEDLNARHEDIIHARVTLEKDSHHQQGADEARVVFILAGQTLTASKRAETLDDAAYAALEAIARQLREFREQRQGVIKEPNPRPRGRIVRLFSDRGYGSIETESQREVYFHANSVHGIPFEKLEVGMVVDLDIEAGEKGPQASRVTPRWP
jgi:ribosomal subunit interface protein